MWWRWGVAKCVDAKPGLVTVIVWDSQLYQGSAASFFFLVAREGPTSLAFLFLVVTLGRAGGTLMGSSSS